MPNKTRKEQLEALLADDPDDPFLQYGLAMECIREGQDEEAVRRFRALLATAPVYVPGYLQAGQALIRLSRDEEAREILRKGVAVARSQGDQHAGDEMQGFLDNLGDVPPA